MSNVEVKLKPSYVMGAVIALAGLVVAWVVPSIGFPSLIAGIITGGFGVASVGRIWPGLPLKKIYEFAPVMAIYGAIVGWIVGADLMLDATQEGYITEDGRKIGGVLMEMKNITLRFGGVKAITDISFDIREGEIRAIIGPNGAGKSSMLNVISGFYIPQEGEVWYQGAKRPQMRPYEVARQGIARTFQNIALFEGMTVLDNVMTGRLNHMNTGLLSQALWKGKAEAEEVANREVVEKVIDFLEIQAIRKTPVARLPYGLKKRVELARALAAQPSLLLLDEPMAGMNVEEKEDMSRFILDVNDEFGTTIALIEHDMGVVMDLSDRVVVMDYGKKIGDGTPDEVRNNQDVIDAYLGVAHD